MEWTSLRERYARGEIDSVEYQSRKLDLELNELGLSGYAFLYRLEKYGIDPHWGI